MAETSDPAPAVSVPQDKGITISRCSTFQRAVIALLSVMTIVLFAIVGCMGWSMAMTDSLTREVESAIGVPETAEPAEPASVGDEVHGLLLREDATDILADHDSGAVGLTADEDEVLSQFFGLYDANGDNLWDLAEFEAFIDAVVNPAARFDAMDLDADSVLSLKEIYLVLASFNETAVFECDEVDAFVYDVFGHHASPRDSLYYEYMAQLWLYELDAEEKVDVISRAKYAKYVQDEEWLYHNHDADSYLDLAEFKARFFDSLYFQNWQKNLLIGRADAAHSLFVAKAELRSLGVAAVASVELTTVPHQFDDAIDAYLDGKTFSVETGEHRVSQTILYAFPYFDRSRTYSTRRRLQTEYCWDDEELALLDCGPNNYRLDEDTMAYCCGPEYYCWLEDEMVWVVCDGCAERTALFALLTALVASYVMN